MQVINESFMHNVPKGAETHFKVVVVSDTFTDVALIKRHRTVNTLLKEELATGVHALTIQAKTVAQWEQSGHAVEPSPKCLGGAGK
jgi:BolA protein